MVTERHDIRARYANPSDFEEINFVFNQSFRLSRSLEEFRWKFLSSPSAARLPAAVVGVINHKIVGVFGLRPHRLLIDGTVTEAIQVLDVCVLPEFHNCGVNRATLRYFLDTAATFGEVAFGFPGDVYATIGLERLGYKLLTSLVAYRWSPDVTMPTAYAEEDMACSIDTASVVPENWARFFRDNLSRFRITTERTIEYLRWRYHSFPHRRFSFLSARRGNELSGIAIVGLLGTAEKQVIWLYEFLVTNRAVALSLLRHILQSFSEAPRREVWYWCSQNNSIQIEFEEVGFQRHQHGLNRVVGVNLAKHGRNAPAFFSHDAWYLTIGDTDL